jgi:hypothetical protein
LQQSERQIAVCSPPANLLLPDLEESCQDNKSFGLIISTEPLGSLPPLQKILGTGPVGCPVYLAAWLGVLLIFGADSLRKSLTGKGAR